MGAKLGLPIQQKTNHFLLQFAILKSTQMCPHTKFQRQKETLLWFVSTLDIPEKFLTMKAADSSKTMAIIGQKKWYPNSGALNLNFYHHEKAKNQKL
jgi:hypothetical protein